MRLSSISVAARINICNRMARQRVADAKPPSGLGGPMMLCVGARILTDKTTTRKLQNWKPDGLGSHAIKVTVVHPGSQGDRADAGAHCGGCAGEGSGIEVGAEEGGATPSLGQCSAFCDHPRLVGGSKASRAELARLSLGSSAAAHVQAQSVPVHKQGDALLYAMTKPNTSP